jgi:hypothetical protein
MSVFSLPHLQHNLLMCFEYLPALAHVGMTFLSSLQPKVCTLGVKFLFFQIIFKSWVVWGLTCLGLASPSSCSFWRQHLYALLELHFPVGVSLQQSISSSCLLRIRVCWWLKPLVLGKVCQWDSHSKPSCLAPRDLLPVQGRRSYCPGLKHHKC